MSKISFVILTWNSDKTIGESLKSIETICRGEHTDYEVIIVDNGSKDGTLGIIDRAKKTMPINLIGLPRNYGTTKPRNMAFRQCTGDIICVLDSDAVLVSGDLHGIITDLKSDDSIGIIAPKLIFPDDTIQHSVRKFPSVIGKFSKIPGIVFKLRYGDLDGYDDFPFTEKHAVDYAISACWFIRRDIFDEVGYMDEHIFYAPEDVDFCIRIWKLGKKTVYYPSFTVLHYVQRITHKKFFGKIARSHFFGVIYYFLKHRYITRPTRRISQEKKSGVSRDELN